MSANENNTNGEKNQGGKRNQNTQEEKLSCPLCMEWTFPSVSSYLISLYAQSGLKETVSLYQETGFNSNSMEGADKNVMCHCVYTSPYLYLPTDLFSVGNKRHLIDT